MTDIKKPYSPACERNQQFILDVLKKIILTSDKNLLEIGSGTGQHAVFMAPSFPHLLWHTSDLLENHEGINLWLKDYEHKNIVKPIEYEVGKTEFPQINVDVVFTTNTLHIMSWKNVKLLIKQLGENLVKETDIVIYGPFNYAGKYTSESNAEFDKSLNLRNEFSGIRDFETIVSLMNESKIRLIDDIEMPANNHILHFKKYK